MKRNIALLLILSLLLALCACGGDTASSNPPAADTPPASQDAGTSDTPEVPSAGIPTLPTVDPSGASISIPEHIDSIVVLAPAQAQTVVALGLGDKIVGYDLNSVGLEGLPTDVPTFDTVNPDVEQLVAIAPDVLLVSNLSLYDQEAPYQPLIDAGVCVICVPSSESIDGVKSDIAFLAAALSVPEAGQALLDELNAGLDEMAATAASIPAEERRSVYFEISAAPYMYSTGSGTYLDEMIRWVGGVNVLADENGWLSVEGETIVAADPDVIFTNVNYIDDPVGEILGRDGWAGVTAIANRDVYYIDSNASSQPNQNIVVAMRQMAAALYPDYFTAG